MKSIYKIFKKQPKQPNKTLQQSDNKGKKIKQIRFNTLSEVRFVFPS